MLNNKHMIHTKTSLAFRSERRLACQIAQRSLEPSDIIQPVIKTCMRLEAEQKHTVQHLQLQRTTGQIDAMIV